MYDLYPESGAATTRARQRPVLKGISVKPGPTVAVVGDNTLDRFLDEDGTELVGGNALNVAVQLALMGINTAYYGAVGNDPEAGIVRDAARKRGVDVDGLMTMGGRTALTCVRHTAAGDRYFESEDFGVTADYAPDQAALVRIARADWVHIGMLPHASDFTQRLVTERPGVRISQDCSVSEGHARLTVAFASAGEDRERARTIARAALAEGAEIAVATLGQLGVYASDGDRAWELPAVPVDVVDTTGAGDSFMAGFIASFLHRNDLAQALSAGTRRGSLTCRYRGGWPQLPGDLAIVAGASEPLGRC
jgi:sugar/nucleoside kinase (ribokinase family)